MGTKTVQLRRFVLPVKTGVFGKPKGSQPIRSNEFIAEFTVQVDETACYAIFVRLVEDDDNIGWFLNPDEVIAKTSSGPIKCYCIKKGSPRNFWVTAAAAPPDNKVQPHAPKYDIKGTELSPVHGSWPETDTGDELEIRLEVDVYRCGQDCSATEECVVTDETRLSEPIIEFESEELDVPLLDADEMHETIERVGGAAGSAAVSAAQKAMAQASGGQDNTMLAMALGKKVKQLEKKLRRMNRRINSDIG